MMNLETTAPPSATFIPMAAQAMAIPIGDPGTEATIAQMRRLIDEGAKDPIVHELAANIIRGRNVRAYDWAGEAQAIYGWVRSNIRFTRDIRGKETLHAAREIIRLGIGDCDDYVILICSLIQTVGGKCRIITVSSDPRAPETFSHVYPEALLGRRWVALDAARRDPAFGRSPARFYRKRIWDASSPDYMDVAGLGIVPVPIAARQRSFVPAMPPVPSIRQRRARMLRSRLRGLGDDDGFWANFPDVVQSGGAAAANIIAASRAAPYNLVPTTAYGPTSYRAQPYGYPYPPASSGFFSGISPNTLMLFGFGLILAFAVSRR